MNVSVITAFNEYMQHDRKLATDVTSGKLDQWLRKCLLFTCLEILLYEAKVGNRDMQ